ncbi:hypothetical protein D1007_62315 [Hordeum vulgare]|nr:hypothetical protein D1007_62315 [Hordeum vulgare]
MSGGSKSQPSQDGSQSPAPREWQGCSRSRHGRGSEVVVREIVRETVVTDSVPTTFPMLTHSNYNEWALIMECNLHAASMWVPMKDDTVDKEDRKATQCPGSNRVREANAQKLRADFENITFKEGELVDDFAMRISSLAPQLRALGDTMDDARVVRKFLHVVPPRFAQVAVSIETLLDLSELSIEELTGQLRVVEDRLEDGRESFGGGQLLLSKELEASKGHGRGGCAPRNGGGTNGAGTRGGGTSRGGGRTQGRAGRGASKEVRDRCRYCNIKGHWAHECRKRIADEDAAAAANLVEVEEDGGPTIMMACVETMQEGLAPPATMVPTSIKAVPEGAAPPTTTVPEIVKSVREARSSSTNPLPTSVALSPTTTFSGAYDWEAMKTQVGHTRKTRFSRFCKPVWVTRHSLLASTPTLTGHSPTTLFSGPFKWEAKKTQSWGGNDSTMTLATNEVVQDAWGSLVGHTTIPCDFRHIDPGKGVLGQCNVSHSDPGKRYLGMCNSKKLDPDKHGVRHNDSGKSDANFVVIFNQCDVRHIDPGKGVLGQCNVWHSNPGKRYLGMCNSKKLDPDKHGVRHNDTGKGVHEQCDLGNCDPGNTDAHE